MDRLPYMEVQVPNIWSLSLQNYTGRTRPLLICASHNSGCASHNAGGEGGVEVDDVGAAVLARRRAERPYQAAVLGLADGGKEAQRSAVDAAACTGVGLVRTHGFCLVLYNLTVFLNFIVSYIYRSIIKIII
jgi:hypothetical protein